MIYEGRSDTPFPLRWSSPEVLLYREYSSKSDVWSYGILLWEIFSLGQIPFGEFVSNDIAAQLIKTGHMPTKPPLANQIIFTQIITPCWSSKASDRPSFSFIKQILKEIIILSQEDYAFL
jgi:Bruton agammaglobulinemia tyrosine kinase